MSENNSACTFEEDEPVQNSSCIIRDYVQTTDEDNNEDDVGMERERCLDEDEEDAINKAKSLGIIGWTVLKRYGGGYDLKKGIIDSYDESTRFFKVKYKDGSMDTIVEREILKCLGPREGRPHYLFVEPPVPEGEEPIRRPVLMRRATPGYLYRTSQRTAKGNNNGNGRNAQAENAGSDGSPKEGHA